MDAIIHSLEENMGIAEPLAFALIAACFSSLGIILASFSKRFSSQAGLWATLFAGVLLAYIAITHLIPETFHLGKFSLMLALCGIVLGVVLDRVGDSKTSNIKVVPISSLLAIGLHSFLDGMIYVASFGHSHEGGVFTGGGLILHELPEGILVFILCKLLFKKTWISIVTAFAIASLSTPLGTLLALALSQEYGSYFVSSAFPVAAGLVSWASLNLIKKFCLSFMHKSA